jgi:hypothetical protein
MSGLRSRILGAADWKLALALGALGFVLALASLNAGLSSIDDLGQRAFIVDHLQGHGDAKRAWWDVYTFLDGDIGQVVGSMDAWASHWWTWPGLKIRFLRPVAAATLYLDYGLFGDRHWLAHLHSALWYFAACFSITLLLLRLSRNRAAAVLAASLYAVDDAHAAMISWLACRNALIAVTFVALSLVAYVHARQRESLQWLAWSVAGLALALLSAEAAVSAIPMFVAYAAFLDRGRPARRMACLLPSLVLTVVWGVIYKHLGFGTFGSGSYLNPLGDGPAFWQALPDRLLGLLRAHFAAPWPLVGPLPFACLAALDLFARWVVLPSTALFVVRTIDRDAEVAFFSVSAAVGLIPLAATLPTERVLVIVGMPLWMLVALLAVAIVVRTLRSARPVKLMAAGALVVSLVMYGVLAPVSLAVQMQPHVPNGLSSPALDHDAALSQRQLILLNVPSLFAPYDVMAERIRKGLPLPARFAVLGSTANEVEVTRVDARSLELYCPVGFLTDPVASHWRGPTVPMRQGDRVRVQEYEALVVRVTPDGRPLRIRFRFLRTLEDPALRFMSWTPRGLEDFALGPIGQRRIIPASFDHTQQLPEELVH